MAPAAWAQRNITVTYRRLPLVIARRPEANSVAAYAMFRPNLPEDFTSPGPVTVYFDTNNNRLNPPQLRLKPDIAAADGANNTFFPLGPGNDYPFDPDTFSNFYGTSAASPHSAAIAALILQATVASVSLTPQQVKTIMQLTAFPHDLDPYFVNGTANVHGGTVNIAVTSDNDANNGTGANDPNSWTVTYTGPGYVKELHLQSGRPGTKRRQCDRWKLQRIYPDGLPRLDQVSTSLREWCLTSISIRRALTAI